MSDLNIAMILRLVDQVTGPSKRVLASMREVGMGVSGAADRLDSAAQRQAASIRGQALEVGALGASIYAAVRPAIEFETALAGINKVVDVSPDALKSLGNDIQNLSTSGGIAQTATEIASIIEEAGKANLIDKSLAPDEMNAAMIEFARNTAQMAVAFEIPAAQAGETMAIWQNALGMAADESRQFADAINHTANNIGTTEAKLIDVVNYVGAVGKSAGLANTEIVGLSAAILSAGASPERAATGLKNFTNALTRGASATDRQQQIFEKLGLDASEMAERMQVDAKGAIIDVLERISELPAAVRNAAVGDLFGEEAKGAIMPLIGNIDNLRAAFELVEDPADFVGAMLREFEAQSGTAANQIKLLINNVNALVTTFTTELLPAIKDIIDSVSPVLQQFRDWVSANPELVAAIGQAALFLLGLKIASLGASIAMFGLIKPVAIVLRGLGWLLRIAAFANPFVLIAAAVALAITAIYDNWDNIVEYFRGKFDRIRAAFEIGWVQGVVAVLREFNPVVLLADAFVGLAIYIGEQVAGWLTSIDEALSGFSLYDSGKAMIRTLWDGAKSIVGDMVADLMIRISGIIPDWLRGYLSGSLGGGTALPEEAVVDTGGPIRDRRRGGDTTMVDVGGITVVARDGQDERAVAAEVGRELDRRTRGRSIQRLSDTPEDME